MSHKLAKLIKRQYQASKSASSKRAQSWTVGDSGPSRGGIANVATGTFANLMRKAIRIQFFSGRSLAASKHKSCASGASQCDKPEFLSHCSASTAAKCEILPLCPSAATIYALLLGTLGIACLLNTSDTYAKPYSMTVTIDNSVIDMNVSPSNNGSFSKSSNSTVSVSTTNASGYTLSIAASGSNGNDGSKLINSSDSNTNTNYLSSIDSAITEEQFKTLPSDGSEPSYNNQWGYMPSMWDGQANTLFRPSPTTTGDVLDHTATANTEANKYTLAIGARVDTTQKIGAYSNTYVVLATANGAPYTITYKDDTISNFPTDESATAEGDKVAISSLTPVKDGYTFLGWCSVSPTNNNGTDTCSGTTYQPNSTWTIDQTSSTNSLTLYAMWSKSKSIDDLLYMQDFNTLSSTDKASVVNLMETGKNYYLMDSRDREVYIIAKLKDGRVWMRDNLRLGSNGGSIALTPSDTNISSNWTLPAGITSGFNSYTTAQINAAYKTDVATHYGQGSGKVGVYYNYCAASAGTYCHNSSSGVGDAEYDVCPIGWRLPTGGSTGEYQVLYSQYSTTQTASDHNGLQYNLSTPLSGTFSGSSRGNNFNVYAGFLSSTMASSFQAYSLDVGAENVWPSNSIGRGNGVTARCILGQ